jgi:transcriptional regulator with GAF, ATPase, and Fis domain/Tfp pilus assembly protein PilF
VENATQVSHLIADRYQVLSDLGGGEIAQIHKVRDVASDRILALKILREGAPKVSGEQMRGEFHYLSRFTHPSIVTAFDFGSTPDGRPYFTMEFVDGLPINMFFATGFRPDLVDVALQLLHALDRIHAQGLVHCDLKPQNLLVTERDGSPRAKLIDFGFAGRLSLSDGHGARGTLGYVAPEVLKGVDADARADLYSLGLVLYEVATGRGPGKERDLRNWLRMQYYSDFRPPRGFDSSIPEKFESVIMSLVQKEPERRPRSAASVIEALSPSGDRPVSEVGPREHVMAPGFVGRGGELASLRALLDDVRRGGARAAFISGERGVGKSRMLSEFKFMAQIEGATILSFEPSSLGARQQSLVETALGYLSVYSPVHIPGMDAGKAPSSDEKYRLFDAVVRSLKELAASPRVHHSLVLMVDDCEQHDATSLEFIRYLVYSMGSERLMLLVAGVNEKRFLDLSAELGRAGCFRHLPLPPMERSEVGALLDSLLGTISDRETLIEWLMKITGGNPLFVIETVRSLAENSILLARSTHWALAADSLNAYLPPDSAIDVERRRLEGLKQDEMAVLKTGAIAARPLTLGFLSAALGLAERSLFNVATRLKSLGLLRSFSGEEGASFVLSSKILETTVLERMPVEEQREHHYRVAQVLELLYPDKRDTLMFDLAHHYAQAGDEDRAFTCAMLAGKRARENGLSELALAHYETALALPAQAGSARERVEIIERVGELREATGKYPEAVDAYRQGMSVIAADAELPDDRPLAARFLRKLGLVYQKQGRTQEALDNLNQALLTQPERNTPSYIDTLNDLGWSHITAGNFGRAQLLLSSALRLAGDLKSRMPKVHDRVSARSFYNLGVLAWSRGDFVLAQQLVERSIEHDEAPGDDHIIGEASQLLATLWWRRGKSVKAREHYERHLPAQRRWGDANVLLRSLQGLGLICRDGDDWDKAHDYFAEALNLAERIGDTRAMADLNSNLGTTCDERGDWSQALVYYRRAIELQKETQADSYGRKVATANLAQLLTRQGELAEAERMLGDLQAMAEPDRNPDLKFVLDDCRIRFLLRAGRLGPALRAIAETFRLVRHERDSGKLARLYTLASELRFVEGNSARAAEDARRALVLLGDRASSKEYAVALRSSGLARCALEQADGGMQEIRRSIELLRNIGSKYELALSLMTSAQALTRHCRGKLAVDLKTPLSFRPVAQQDVNEALADLKEAQLILRSTGARPDARRTDELIETVTHLSATMRLKARGREEYLKVFYQISDLIGMSLEKEDFFERILDSVIDVIKAERGLLFLMQDGKLVPAAARNVDHTTIDDATEISHSILRKVRRQGETVFSADALTDPRFSSANSVVLQKIRSVLCVPLRVENRVIGTIYVDSRATAHLFLEEDMHLLVSVAKLLAATIDKSAAFRKLQDEMSVLKEDTLVDAATGYFMGRSRAMKEVYRIIDRIAPSSCTVLLTGETGTGKGVLARLIHAKSERRATRFVSINCGALPENLFESELFGHARGSFTGAVRDKVGIFEAAMGGTVFLDEISNTTLGVQAKLLQVLDEKVVRRVGETEPRLVDVRLICATNRELREEVQAGRFREDLFYRMNGVTVKVPALRERSGDLTLLADYFVKRYAARHDKHIEACDKNVHDLFADYAWPGNIRELQNVIERAVIMAQRHRITTDDLGEQFAGTENRTVTRRGKRRHLERREVVNALRATGGNVSQAAELLGAQRRQFQRLIQRHRIDRANPS